MKNRKVIWPGNPSVICSYALLGLFSFWIYIRGQIRLPEMLFFVLIILSDFLFNSYLWYLEIDDKGISGPGRFGPAHRVKILWNQGEVHFGKNRIGIHYLIISDTQQKSKIKVMEANFSKRQLYELKQFFDRHTPPLKQGVIPPGSRFNA